MTSIWGPDFWKVINHVTTNYPDNPTNEDKTTHYDFFNNIGKVLPCNKCRNNYQTHFDNTELNNGLNSKNDLINYVINFHNKVNKSIGNPELDNYTARKIMFNHFIFEVKHLFYFIFFLIIILLIFILFKKKIIKK